MDSVRCRGTRRDGTPCGAPAHAVLSDGYCWAHSPANATARREARAAGGRGRSNAARAERLVPQSLRPVFDTLRAALTDVRDGSISPAQAGALAALASALVRVFTAGQLEQRLDELEAAEQARRGSA